MRTVPEVLLKSDSCDTRVKFKDGLFSIHRPLFIEAECEFEPLSTGHDLPVCYLVLTHLMVNQCLCVLHHDGDVALYSIGEPPHHHDKGQEAPNIGPVAWRQITPWKGETKWLPEEV